MWECVNVFRAENPKSFGLSHNRVQHGSSGRDGMMGFKIFEKKIVKNLGGSKTRRSTFEGKK